MGLAGGNLNLSTLDAVFRCITITGSECGSKKMVEEVLSLVAQKKAGYNLQTILGLILAS